MRAQRSFAAILLLALFCMTARSATINKRIFKSRRENTTRTILSKDNVKEQNPKIPVAYNSGKIDDDLPSLTDGQNVVSKREDGRTSVDQQVDQSEIVLIRDVEDMEHALSIMEYEPQKINKKEKRKINVPHKNADLADLNIETKDPVPTMVDNTYHDPSQLSKPKKISLIPKYYQHPSEEGPKPSNDGPRSRSKDSEYPYPTLRPRKSRFSKNRPSTSLPEETKLENVPPSSSTHQSDEIVTNTPNSVPQPSRTIRTKKIRKRPRDNKRNFQENNYNKSRNFESKKRLRQNESDLEKLEVEGVNRSSNVSNNEDEVQPGKVTHLVRSPHGGRRVYERKHVKNNTDGSKLSAGAPVTLSSLEDDIKGSNDYQTKLEDYKNNKGPLTKDSNVYKNDRTSSSFEDYRNDKGPMTHGYDDDPVTRSSLTPRIHQSIQTSAVPSDLEVYGEVTTAYSNGPAPSTTRETSLPIDDWTPGTKLNRLKEDDEEETDERNSDVVAEATNLENEDNASDERRGDDFSHSHRQIYRNDAERDGETYENDDAQAEGTHGDEKYEGSKEGDGKGSGDGKGEFEEGGGAKREEGHHEVKDEKGEKGYESWHKDEKGSKGHHNKERHKNHYEEKDEKEKEHKEEGEYHEEHQQGEKGEKAAEFDEKGEHQKGYNTKGEHSVHKKDEFEKRTEFFDEFQEGDDFEKEGEFHREHESSKGGHEKMAHLDKADHEEHYGKKEKHENGKHHHEEGGHKINEGKEDHYEHEEMHGEKKGQEEEKKWGYKKGDDGDGGGKGDKSDDKS